MAPGPLSARAGITHHCDNPFAYGLMVNAGLGIGLLANFVMSDPDFLPVDIGIHIKLPICIHAQADRLKSRPVPIVLDWLADVFSAEKPIFRPELNLGLIAKDAFSVSMRHLTMGMARDHE